MKILELLSEQGALSDQQISTKLKYNIITVQQILSIYMDFGYILRDKDGQYDLSIKIIDISKKFKQRCEIKDIAHSHLRRISEKYNETTTLGALEKTSLVYVDKIDSMELLRFVPRIEQRITAHHTALGKSILAHLPVKELNLYCHTAPWKPVALKSIDTQEKLLIRLRQIKKQGFAISDEEFCPGLRSIAVPILDSLNYPRFSIGIWGPLTRMIPSILREMQIDLTDASLAISKYYSVPEHNAGKSKSDTPFFPIPEKNRQEFKKTFFERALAMFL